MSPLETLRYHVTGAIERGEKQPVTEQPAMKYHTTYEAPGPTGATKGSMETTRQYKRGEAILTPFGRATVRSSRVANPTPSPWRK